MGQVTLVLGFQPNEFDNKPKDFFSRMKPDRLMYQCGNLQGVEYSKPFMDRIANYANGVPFLVGCDSHDFNNWADDAHWDTVLKNSAAYARYAHAVGASGIVLNTEQENHQIPFGPGGRYIRMDSQFVWPADPPALKPVKPGKKGAKPIPAPVAGPTGPVRCEDWVMALDEGFTACPVAIWLTSAVQASAPPNLYPCMNSIAETAGGVELWPYMWLPGYDWGNDPHLPKRKLLPNKKDPSTWPGAVWCDVVRQSFSTKFNNVVAPVFSFSPETVTYYQKQIAAGQVKDFYGMISPAAIAQFKGSPRTTIILWGDVFAADPHMEDYVTWLMQALRG